MALIWKDGAWIGGEEEGGGTGNASGYWNITGDPVKTLALFNSKLAQTMDGSGLTTIACLGDSLTEGYYVDSLDKRWTNQLADSLSRLTGKPKIWWLPVASGLGHGDANWPNADDPWTITGTATFAPGYYAPNLITTNLGAQSKMSTTFYGTQVQVAYTRSPASVGNSVRITIDGVERVSTLHTLAPTVMPSQLWTSPVLDPGEHTIEIEYFATTGVANFEGLLIYEGGFANGAVGVYNWGHGGYGAKDFAASDHAWETLYNAIIEHSLIVVELGVNDNSAGRTALEFENDYREVLSRLKNIASVDTGFIILAWRPNSGWTQAKKDLWNDSYIPIMKELAEEQVPGRHMVVEPTLSFAEADVLFPDGVHPTGTSGAHAWITRMMLDVMGVSEIPVGALSSRDKSIENIITLTEAEYEALTILDPRTMYVVI